VPRDLYAVSISKFSEAHGNCNAPDGKASGETYDHRAKNYDDDHIASNDEVERRGVAPALIEADLSQSSTPSLAHRRRAPRSLEPIVRFR
jgi:hypothetical protein